MSTNFFTKQPSEEYDIAVDFTNKLDTGRTIVSATVAALDTYTGTSATSTVLDDGVGTVGGAGKIVSEGVKAGSNGHQYKITFLTTLDNGDKLEEDVFMQIQEI